jgi:hypothetical protein
MLSLALRVPTVVGLNAILTEQLPAGAIVAPHEFAVMR